MFKTSSSISRPSCNTFCKTLEREREREREGGREEERKRGREEERKRVSATTINKKVTVPKRNTIIILNDKMFR